MTPAESIAALNAAIAAQQAAAKAVSTAESTALTVHAADWLERARTAIPTPDGAIEEHTPLSEIGRRYTGCMVRHVTKLLSITPAGGVRLQRITQQAGSSHVPAFDRLALLAEPVGPAKVEEFTHAGNTRNAETWRKRFGIKP